MKKIIILFILGNFLIGCSKPSALEKQFHCSKRNQTNIKIKTYKDFKKNFKLSIPTNWKTNLYYDSKSSDIYAADTLKSLSKSYIIGVSYQLNNLVFNEQYFNSVNKLLEQNNLNIIVKKEEDFLNKKAFWYVAEGIKNNRIYHELNVSIKNNNSSYLILTSEIYGDKDVNERICKSLAIFKSLKILE